LCKTKSYKELGLNIPELEDAARPYTEREGIPINVGLTRQIVDVGQFQGKFEDFLKTRGEKYQLNMLGKNRFDLYTSGKVEFSDFVNENGDLVLLKDLLKRT
jgi:hypothetical protein